LIDAAEQAGFEVLLTTDKNIRTSATNRTERSQNLFGGTWEFSITDCKTGAKGPVGRRECRHYRQFC
jgi:hypothetical protein